MVNLLYFTLLCSFGSFILPDATKCAFVCNLLNENTLNITYDNDNNNYVLSYDMSFSISVNNGEEEEAYFFSRPLEDTITTIYEDTLPGINVLDFCKPTGFNVTAENLQHIDLINNYAIYNLDLFITIYLNNDYSPLYFYDTLYIELDLSEQEQYFNDYLSNATYIYWTSDIEIDYNNIIVDSYQNGYSVGYGSGYAQGEQDGYNNGYQQGYNDAQGQTINDALNISSFINAIIQPINALLTVEIFPNITMWNIISIPLILGAVAFVFRWFR